MGTNIQYYAIGILLGLLVIFGQGQQIDIQFQFEEEQHVGFLIGVISTKANIDITSGSNFKITSKDFDLANITNEATGELRTAQIIDREEVCRNEIKCEKEIQVVNSTPYLLISVTLIIDDINDNAPQFAKDKEVVSLSESQALGMVRPLPAAVDLDRGVNNSITSYEFSRQSDNPGVFELQIEMTNNLPTSLKLKLVGELDREVKDKYLLYVLAKDSGTPKRTGTLTVEIIVEDDNDNKPVFDDPIVNVSVTEDIAVGKVVYTFQAHDIDDGKNGEVQYSLGQLQSNYIFDHFVINETSGELSVTKELVFEAGYAERVIVVVAQDKGDNPQSAQATLYLTVKDIDNNAPEISVTIFADNLRVSENVSLETPILHVSVTDSDTGVDGQIQCNLYSTYFGLEKVQEKNYKVYVQHLLDRETNPRHNITITCNDGGGLTVSESFLITVTDENDHTPQFSKYVYYVNMTENNEIGDFVLTVLATDDDIDENGRISYNLPANDDFEINEVTGVIQASKQLDFETDRRKIFEVLAIDNSKTEPRTGTATVQVNIVDVNDNAPAFTNPDPVYNLRVSEGLGSNAHVGFVTALDPDSGDSGRVSYDIAPQYKSGSVDAVPFVVIGDGEIKTTMDLDREQHRVFVFEVLAFDFGTPSLTSTARVKVTILDENDETPYFTFPTADNKTVVALNEVSDVPIANLTALDDDAGINKELIYFIADGDPNSIFSLVPNSGLLFIVKYVHLTEDTVMKLSVSVYDKGDPPLSATGELIVKLKYTNATTVEPYTDLNKSYIIIVVSVVCVTCVLSATIITVICLIRRKDRDCGKAGPGLSKLSLPSVLMKHGNGKQPTAPPIQDDKVYPTESMAKNKKEVSFSLDDADSLSSNDFKPLTSRTKELYPSRQTTLEDMPEEAGFDVSSVGMLHPPKSYTQAHTKYLNHDVQMNACHHREDSHSETSGESGTTQDSGNGNSVVDGADGTDNYDLKFDMNRSACLIINPTLQPSSSRTSNRNLPKPSSPSKSTYLTFQDSYSNKTTSNKTSEPHNSGQKGSKPWYTTGLDINGSYPESDYHSLSTANNSHCRISPYSDEISKYSSTNPNSANHHRTMPVSNYVYYNTVFSDNSLPYRTNSVREDDETTTTSGSYTINHDDVDAELSRQYQMSQVV